MMKTKERLSFIKKRLLDSRTILFTIIFSLLMLVIYGCIIIMNFSIDVRYSIMKENDSYRTIVTNMPSEEIKNLENVEYFTSEKYKNELWAYIPEYDKGKEKGFIFLKPLLNNIDLEIVRGRTLENENEAVCPEKFYPFNYYDRYNFNNSLYLKGKNIINTTFKFTPFNYEKKFKTSTFKIVGTYKNKQFVEANSCYISIKDFDNNQEKYRITTTEIDENGNEIEKNIDYTDNIVFADKYENVENIIDSIVEKGYSAYQMSYFNETFLNLVFYIPLLISIIVVLLCICIMYNFIAKKGIYHLKEIGILRAIGYYKDEILKIEVLENVLICLIDFVISIALMILCYYIGTNVFFKEYIFLNYSLQIPIIYLLIFSILILTLIIIMTRKNIKKHLKKDTSYLLKSGDNK